MEKKINEFCVKERQGSALCFGKYFSQKEVYLNTSKVAGVQSPMHPEEAQTSGWVDQSSDYLNAFTTGNPFWGKKYLELV